MLVGRKGVSDIVDALLHAGADVNAVNNKSITSLMCAAECGHNDIVNILLQAGRCRCHC